MKWALLILGLIVCACAPQQLTEPDQPPLKQHTIGELACGPTALVNAFSHASPRWRSSHFFDSSPKVQAESIIRIASQQRSTQFPTQSRWSSRKGIRAKDLYTTAREVSPRSLKFSTPDSSATASALTQVHYQEMKRSLSSGFPPILSVKHQLHKKFQHSEGYYWKQTKGHFITVLSLGALETTSFSFQYIDPLDGKTHQGKIFCEPTGLLTTSPLTRQPIHQNQPNLSLIIPSFRVPKEFIGANGTATSTVDSVIAAF